MPSANPKDGYYIAGMATAMSMVDVLKRAGRNLTRASVMKAARSQNQPKHPLLIPGIAVKTSPRDGFPIEQVTLQRWVSGKGSADRPLVDVRPAANRDGLALPALQELERAGVLAQADRLVQRRRLRAGDRVDDAARRSLFLQPVSANRHTAEARPRRR